jgi:hypothetical protein
MRVLHSETATLFLYDLGVLDHGDAAALSHFALQCDRLAAVLSQLIVHRLVFTDHEIRFAVADNPDWTAALDALGPTRLPVFLADGIVIDIAHHIHDFAGHFFRSGCVTAMLVCLRERQRRDRQSCDEYRCNGDFQQCRFVIA